MKKDVPIRLKYRYILLQGKIKPLNNGYIFVRHPFSDCPVIEMEHKSKWDLVERVYDLIKELT